MTLEQALDTAMQAADQYGAAWGEMYFRVSKIKLDEGEVGAISGPYVREEGAALRSAIIAAMRAAVETAGCELQTTDLESCRERWPRGNGWCGECRVLAALDALDRA